MRKSVNILKLICLCLALLVSVCSNAYADVFGTFATRAGTFAKGYQQFAFCMGGFGIVMFTWCAICGKINFKHLGYIMICLFFLSGTGLLIQYIGGKEVSNGLSGFASPSTFTGGAHDTYQNMAEGDSSAPRSSSLGE